MVGRRPERGLRLGQYVLEERIGSGGFAEVWRAVHAEIPGKLAAVKIPTSEEYVRQLRGEAVLEHRLEHPHIVRTLDLDTRHDPPYFVMEFVAGENLRERLRRTGPLPWREAAQLAHQVLEGLAYAHAKGVLHRDIKPENLLLTPEGEVKVTDFGLGKAHTDATLSFARSQVERSADLVQGAVAAEVAGTWGYMAPEQARGGETDARADLYAVGVVLYEALRGSARVLRLPIAGAPATLSAVVERATEDNPVDRYQGADAMRRALRLALDDRAEAEVAPARPLAGGRTGSLACACGHRPAADARFCERCGRGLEEWSCPGCEKLNPAWLERCWNCGHANAGPAAAGGAGVGGREATAGPGPAAADAGGGGAVATAPVAARREPESCPRCAAPRRAGAPECGICGWAAAGRAIELNLPEQISPWAYLLLTVALGLLLAGVRGSIGWQLPGATAFVAALWLAFRRGGGGIEVADTKVPAPGGPGPAAPDAHQVTDER